MLSVSLHKSLIAKSNSHFHEVVVALLQVGLRQANSHWNHGILLNASALDPVPRWYGSLLKENMLDGGRSCIDEGSNGGESGDLNKHFEA